MAIWLTEVQEFGVFFSRDRCLLDSCKRSTRFGDLVSFFRKLQGVLSFCHWRPFTPTGGVHGYRSHFVIFTQVTGVLSFASYKSLEFFFSLELATFLRLQEEYKIWRFGVLFCASYKAFSYIFVFLSMRTVHFA